MPETNTSSYREVFIGLRQHDLQIRALIPKQSGGPIPILWLHGFLQSADSWQNVSHQPWVCTKTWSCFVDLPGHGFSDWSSCTNQQVFQSIMQDTVESLVEFIQVQTGKNPVLIGWSYGGYFLGEYLRQNPNAPVRHVFGVNGAFLLNPAFQYIGPDFLKYSLGFVDDDPIVRNRADEDFLQAIWRESSKDCYGNKSPGDNNNGVSCNGDMPKQAMSPPPNHADRVSLQARQMYLSLREDYTGDILSALVPISLIATRDDSVIRFRMSQSMTRKKKQLSFIELKHGGHGFFHRQPDVLLDFLRKKLV